MKRVIFVSLLGLPGALALGSMVGAQGGIVTYDKVAIGTPSPGQRLHVADGHILVAGGPPSTVPADVSLGGVSLQIKHGPTALITGAATAAFPSGRTWKDPIFHLGRIIQAGDHDPEFRVLYSDSGEDGSERPVLEFDRKGIVASVAQERGSHFEGFACIKTNCLGDNPNDAQPVFRLNSYPDMQLELGPGGDQPTDVFIRRCGAKCLMFPQKAIAGTISADDYLVRTSLRLDEDVAPLSAAEALIAVQRLRPVTYVTRDAPATGRIGLATGELPNASSTRGRQDLSAVEMLALLTRVVQEQQERIEALELQFGDGQALRRANAARTRSREARR